MKALVFLSAILIAFVPSAGFGAGTFSTSVIKASPGPTGTDCIVYNNPNSGKYDPANYDGEDIAVAWQQDYGWSGDVPCNWRHEVMQTFLTPSDANMGGFEIKLRSDSGTANPLVGVSGRTLIISLYQMRDIQDPVPEDKNLLARWTSALPAGIDTNNVLISDPNRGNAGDWLKFTFSPGYHLQADKQYGIRLAFASPQMKVDDANLYSYMYLFVPSDGANITEGSYNNKPFSGTYAYGTAARYYPMNRSNTYFNYWWLHGRDFKFGVVNAATGTPIAYGKRGGDADFDGKVQMGDFAKMASNWNTDSTRALSDTSIPYLYDVDLPTQNVLVINNQPPSSPEPNDTPHQEWTRNTTRLFELAQSFRAPSNATMGAIAVQLSTGTWPVSEDTSGDYTISVYSVPDNNTAPTGTPLKTFTGHFFGYFEETSTAPYDWTTSPTYGGPPYHADEYTILQRQVNQGEWLTFVLPSGVSLTAGNYYAFTLEWNADFDPEYIANYENRKFYVDSSDPNNYPSSVNAYPDGAAFYKSLESSPSYWPLGCDLDFAILGKQYVCTSNIPGFREVTGDLNGDCKVDFKDVDVLARNWLLTNIH
jgi:hypothetical protein